MGAYAKAYDDFTIVDGTHNTVMYDLKLMPYTNVCALGKSIVSGVCLDESENGDTIAEGLDLFGLAKKGATLMTDGGSAYPACAEKNEMYHCLCTNHFQQEVFASCGGLRDASQDFKRDAMALIYAPFSTHENWKISYLSATQKYQPFASASKCLNNIYKSRKKVCRAFTGRHCTLTLINPFDLPLISCILGHLFTCNHCASVRGESVNSNVKEKGKKKSELRKFNLYDLMLHLLNQFNRLQAQSLNDICELVKSNKKWSSYVQKIWTESLLASSKFPFAKEVAPGQWEVSSQPNFAEILHVVVLRDQDMDGIPTCNCPTFLSSKIPCPGICAVFNRIEDELLLVKNLYPRWRLSRHPLYQQALCKLNLCDVEPCSPPLNDINPSDDAAPFQNHLDMQSYQSILYPSKRDVRYNKLNQAFKKIEGKCVDNEHFYKLMMVNLTKFGNSMLGTSPASFQLPSANEPLPLQIPILPPRKRGQTSSSDDVNRFEYFKNFFYTSTF